MKQESTLPQTLKQAIEYFSDADRCFNLMMTLRWSDGVAQCPVCKNKDLTFISTRKMWKCKSCKKQFSIKVGTIMEDSALGLDVWLGAIWLIANAKNGISSMEIHRSLGVTRKTAWFLLHRIRLAMQTGSFEKMSGDVEADETYIGGQRKYMHKAKRDAKIKGRGTVGKAIVMGMLTRGEVGSDGKKKQYSKVRAQVINDISRKTIHQKVRDNVEAGSHLFTDTLASYEGLDEYVHRAVNHAERYVDGNVHTNNMENFWTLLKRCIKGTYIAVEPDHLHRYVAEESFRYNNRKETDAQRFIGVLSGVNKKRLTYKQLIGS